MTTNMNRRQFQTALGWGAASIALAGSIVFPWKSVSTSVTAASDLMLIISGCVGANQTLVGIRIEKNTARPDITCIKTSRIEKRRLTQAAKGVKRRPRMWMRGYFC